MTALTLELVREIKIRDLVPHLKAGKRWEASGVLAKDEYCFVVFDNRTDVGRFPIDLQPGEANSLLGISHADSGYEGIAWNAAKQQFYLLVEAREHASDCFQGAVEEFDEDFQFLKERTLDFDFQSDSKGFEAIAHVRRDDQDYVLALCEGNKCRCGSKGRKPGGGRIQLFEKKRKRWAHVETIRLPAFLPFVDYSGMSIDQGRVAIVSQVNSMLWVGQFDEASWDWRDDGQLYEFPRTDEGAIRYGNIEGVSWLSPTQIVAVSDRCKKDQPGEGLEEQDQSVHIFDLPS